MFVLRIGRTWRPLRISSSAGSSSWLTLRGEAGSLTTFSARRLALEQGDQVGDVRLLARAGRAGRSRARPASRGPGRTGAARSDLGHGLVDARLPQDPDRRRDRQRHGDGQDQPDPPPHGPEVVRRASSPRPGWSSGVPGRPADVAARRPTWPWPWSSASEFPRTARFRPWVPPRRVRVSSPGEARRGGDRLRHVEPRRGGPAVRPEDPRPHAQGPRDELATPQVSARAEADATASGSAGRLDREARGAPASPARWPGTAPAVRPAPGRAAAGSGRRCPPPGPARRPSPTVTVIQSPSPPESRKIADGPDSSPPDVASARTSPSASTRPGEPSRSRTRSGSGRSPAARAVRSRISQAAGAVVAELDPLDRLPGQLGREPLLPAARPAAPGSRPAGSPARRGGWSGSAGTPGSPRSPGPAPGTRSRSATPSSTTPQRKPEKQ